MQLIFALILYPETFLNSFISYNSFFGGAFRDFYIKYQTVTVLLLPFQFGFLLFLFFCLIAVAQTSDTMLWEGAYLCLLPDLRGKAFNSSQLVLMLAVGLSYTALIMLRYIPSITTLLRVFIINGCWILSEVFSASSKMIMWFLSFILLMWCITLIDLWILNHPSIPGKNPAWSWCTILLTYCWILFANTFWRFLICVHQWYWPVIFLFFVVSLSGFGIRVMLAS